MIQPPLPALGKDSDQCPLTELCSIYRWRPIDSKSVRKNWKNSVPFVPEQELNHVHNSRWLKHSLWQEKLIKPLPSANRTKCPADQMTLPACFLPVSSISCVTEIAIAHLFTNSCNNAPAAAGYLLTVTLTSQRSKTVRALQKSSVDSISSMQKILIWTLTRNGAELLVKNG